ncbi:hypothetical protein FGO68_gene10534 [Halteria grandinella]|uniref:Uncharacterized protein n=1 Tax=Halteria grandinella TaxID=5974 RepID=A0A8J8NQJ9_HALGN|nr:hypothetical protein FGO68_gene10534 [Halteria grandinella]
MNLNDQVIKKNKGNIRPELNHVDSETQSFLTSIKLQDESNTNAANHSSRCKNLFQQIKSSLSFISLGQYSTKLYHQNATNARSRGYQSSWEIGLCTIVAYAIIIAVSISQISEFLDYERSARVEYVPIDFETSHFMGMTLQELIDAGLQLPYIDGLLANEPGWVNFQIADGPMEYNFNYTSTDPSMKFGLQIDELPNSTVKFDSQPENITDIKSFKNLLLNMEKPFISHQKGIKLKCVYQMQRQNVAFVHQPNKDLVGGLQTKEKIYYRYVSYDESWVNIRLKLQLLSDYRPLDRHNLGIGFISNFFTWFQGIQPVPATTIHVSSEIVYDTLRTKDTGPMFELFVFLDSVMIEHQIRSQTPVELIAKIGGLLVLTRVFFLARWFNERRFDKMLESEYGGREKFTFKAFAQLKEKVKELEDENKELKKQIGQKID